MDRSVTFIRRLATAFLCLLLAFPLCFAEEAADAAGLEVHFLRVQRNDAILLVCDGEAAFIDGGAYGYGETCVEYLKNAGIDHLKYYIGTHAHVDHIGMAGPLILAIPTDEILTNYDLALTCMLDKAKTAEEKEAIRSTPIRYLQMGQSVMLGSAVIECVGPDDEVFIPQRKYTNGPENHNSLLLRVSYGDTSCILLGDMTTDGLEHMVRTYPDLLTASVIKSPHHDAGIPEDLMPYLKCEYFVFSTSREAPPKAGTIGRVRRAGGRVFITNYNNAGGLIFRSDGETVTVETEYKLDEKWKLSKTEVTLKQGGSVRITPDFRRSTMIDTLCYTTSDPSVAVVDPVSGRITAVAPGVCVVRALAFDNTYREVTVTVKSK